MANEFDAGFKCIFSQVIHYTVPVDTVCFSADMHFLVCCSVTGNLEKGGRGNLCAQLWKSKQSDSVPKFDSTSLYDFPQVSYKFYASIIAFVK